MLVSNCLKESYPIFSFILSAVIEKEKGDQ